MKNEIILHFLKKKILFYTTFLLTLFYGCASANIHFHDIKMNGSTYKNAIKATVCHGNMYVAVNGEGVFVSQDYGNTFSTHITKSDSGLPSNWVRDIVCTDNGVYFSTQGGVAYYDNDSGKLTNNHKLENVTSVIPFARNHEVLVTTFGSGVLTCRNLSCSPFAQIPNSRAYNFTSGIYYSSGSSSEIRSVLGTWGSGIYLSLGGQDMQKITAENSPDKLSSDYIFDINRVGDNFYISTKNGLVIVDKEMKAWRTIYKDQSFFGVSGFGVNLYAFSDSGIYISDNGGGEWVKKPLDYSPRMPVLSSGNNRLIFSTLGHGFAIKNILLYKYDFSKKYLNGNILKSPEGYLPSAEVFGSDPNKLMGNPDHEGNPNALSLNSNSAIKEYLKINEGDNLAMPFTVSFSVRYRNIDRDLWSRVFDAGTNGPINNVVMIGHAGYTDALAFESFNGTARPPTTRVWVKRLVSLNQWHHYKYEMLIGGKLKVYRDGSLIDLNNPPASMEVQYNDQSPIGIPDIPRPSFYIGKSNWPNDGYLTGDISDFSIYQAIV